MPVVFPPILFFNEDSGQSTRKIGVDTGGTQWMIAIVSIRVSLCRKQIEETLLPAPLRSVRQHLTYLHPPIGNSLR